MMEERLSEVFDITLQALSRRWSDQAPFYLGDCVEDGLGEDEMEDRKAN